jgi:hypothetical protein
MAPVSKKTLLCKKLLQTNRHPIILHNMTSHIPYNTPSDGLSRRKFIFLSAMTAGSVAAGAVPRLVSANDKLNIAVVGYGGQGAGDSRAFVNENVIALCDADEKIGAGVKSMYPKATYYQDFRKMLEKEPTIDALNIATPDHLHAVIAATAMRMGKHVYVQKPLAHSVYEARLLRRLATECKVATQMGNQGSASAGLRRGVEVIQSGIIGQVHDVHVWSNRPIWPQGLQRPDGSDPIPDGFDWDLWIGPAAMRPYKGRNPVAGSYPNYYHTFNWRGWVDFGTGALGDMACHTCNLPFRGLKLGYPTEVEAETLDLTKDCYPIKSNIRFQFPAREGLDPLTFRWYDGGNRVPNPSGQRFHDGNNKPAPEITADILTIFDRIPGSGCLMIGDKGQIFSDSDYGTSFYLKLKDEKEFSNGATHPAVQTIPITIPRFQAPPSPAPAAGVEAPVAGARGGRGGRGGGGGIDPHHAEWLAACKGGPAAYSNFDIAAYLTEIMVLGCVAMRAGKKLEWDGPNMVAKNAPEAAQFVHPEFRKGWEI